MSQQVGKRNKAQLIGIGLGYMGFGFGFRACLGRFLAFEESQARYVLYTFKILLQPYPGVEYGTSEIWTKYECEAYRKVGGPKEGKKELLSNTLFLQGELCAIAL